MKLRRGHFLLVPLAVAPFVLAPIGAKALIPRISAAIVRPLTAAASWTSITVRLPAGAVLPAPRLTDPPPRPVSPVRTRAASRKMEPGARGVVVARERLLHLTAEQLRAVGWATVVNARGQAAGVRLSGIGRLGLGLEDGDVVTSINGRPTPTEDEATAAGAAAWMSGAPTARADVARGDRIVVVTLELPLRGRE